MTRAATGRQSPACRRLPTRPGPSGSTTIRVRCANQIITAGQGQWPAETPVCYNYDVAANTWNSFPNLILGRRNHAGAFVPGWQNSGGVPGMWIWGGRAGTDTALKTSGTLQMTSTAIGEGGQGAFSQSPECGAVTGHRDRTGQL